MEARATVPLIDPETNLLNYVGWRNLIFNDCRFTESTWRGFRLNFCNFGRPVFENCDLSYSIILCSTFSDDTIFRNINLNGALILGNRTATGAIIDRQWFINRGSPSALFAITTTQEFAAAFNAGQLPNNQAQINNYLRELNYALNLLREIKALKDTNLEAAKLKFGEYLVNLCTEETIKQLSVVQGSICIAIERPRALSKGATSDVVTLEVLQKNRMCPANFTLNYERDRGVCIPDGFRDLEQDGIARQLQGIIEDANRPNNLTLRLDGIHNDTLDALIVSVRRVRANLKGLSIRITDNPNNPELDHAKCRALEALLRPAPIQAPPAAVAHFKAAPKPAAKPAPTPAAKPAPFEPGFLTRNGGFGKTTP